MNNQHLLNTKRRLTLAIARYYLSIGEIRKAQRKISRYWNLTKPCNSYELFYVALYGNATQKAEELFRHGIVAKPDYPL